MKRYPSYKDAGVSWLGQVPAHWPLVRIGSQTALRSEKGSDKDFTPLSVTKLGVVPQLETAAKTDDGDNRKVVRQGDFVINGRSDRKGSSGVSAMDGSVSLINITVKLGVGFYPRFAHHLFRSYAFQEEFYRWGRGIVADLWSTNYWDFKRILCAMPTLEEQEAIANYLDAELEAMNSAISSQERMIELLKERRSVIITEAVTKGLDPQAKMKDSGDPRLGLIPEKWEAIPLRYLGRLNGGAGFPDDEQLGRGGDIDFYKVKDLGAASPDGQMSGSDNSVNEEKARRLGAYIFKPDSILFAKVGAALLMNRFRLSKSRFCADNNVMGFEPMQAKIAASYCYFAMQTIDFSVIVNPGTVPSINERQVSSIRIPVPSLEEQSLIAKKLNKVLSTLDELSGKAATCVNLLKERRSALITQAVTGQIDVR